MPTLTVTKISCVAVLLCHININPVSQPSNRMWYVLF